MENNEKETDVNLKISSHGKDISIKDFTARFLTKPYEVLGLDFSGVVRSIEKELPSITAVLQEGDDIFLLSDGTYLIVDYESCYRRENTLKYLNYCIAIINRYDPGCKGITIRVLVIYTCDVRSAQPSYKAGNFSLNVETYYMRNFPGTEKMQKISDKIDRGEELDEKDFMALSFATLCVRGNKKKNRVASEVLDLVEKIQKNQPEGSAFLIAHIATMLTNILDL